jgi:TonB family protein
MSRLAIPPKNKNMPLPLSFTFVIAMHIIAVFIVSVFARAEHILNAAGLPDSSPQKKRKILEVELKEYPITITEDDIIEIMKKEKRKPKPPEEPEPEENTIENEVVTTLSMEFKRNYVSEIMLRLHRNKKYPESERRRGHEGEVVVRFSVHPNGSVSGMAIERGCPYPLLNDAALRTVRRAAPYPRFDEHKNPIRVVVSIDYTLR